MATSNPPAISTILTDVIVVLAKIRNGLEVSGDTTN
jgi:hypothetical protein